MIISKLTKAPPVAKPPVAAPTGGYTGQSSVKPPRYIDDQTTESAAGNVLAQGHANADRRYLVKQQARNGVSTGAGQNFVAAQGGTEAMSKAAQSAADIRSQDQMANDKMRSDYGRMMEQEAQNSAMVQHQIAQANWAKKFATQSAQSQLEMAYYQSRLQLMLALMR